MIKTNKYGRMWKETSDIITPENIEKLKGMSKYFESEQEVEYKTPSHYDNSNGSLYKWCEEKELNSYEFDIIKRVMRCRKKGQFIEDIDKTIELLKLYKKEHLK